MSGNRKKHTNTVQVGSILKWVVIAFFLGVTGLCYVYISNHMHMRSNEIGKMEKELGRLKALNDEAESKIAQYSSRPVLQRRLNDGFIKMQPITDDRIVRINTPQRAGGNELRAVANRESEK